MHPTITKELVDKHLSITKNIFDYGVEEFRYHKKETDYRAVSEFMREKFERYGINSYSVEYEPSKITYICYTGPILSIGIVSFNNESIVTNTRLTNIHEEYGFR